MRYARKVDANQTAVVSALLGAGAVVEDLSGAGDGLPDLLVGSKKSGRFALFEVKDGAKPKSAQKLTPAQVKFHEKWAGFAICTVDGPEAALRHFRVLDGT